MLDHATPKHGWINKIIKNHRLHIELMDGMDEIYTPLLIILFTPSFAGREKGLYLIGNYTGVLSVLYRRLAPWKCDRVAQDATLNGTSRNYTVPEHDRC